MTSHEVAARIRKASKLATVLIDHGATAAEVLALPASHRSITATLAGVHDASPLTWETVADMVAGHWLAEADRQDERDGDREGRELARAASRSHNSGPVV